MTKLVWLIAALSYPMLAFTYPAYPELQISHGVEIVSATAVSRLDMDQPGKSQITVTANLLFGNICMVPDILFKNRTLAPGLVQIWIRGVSKRNMLCTMLYLPIEISVVVDNEIWNNNEIPRIEVNGKAVDIQ
ncbi:MAG: hypothetical protein AABZ06_08085 [Bdellovibrionota bacterium]